MIIGLVVSIAFVFIAASMLVTYHPEEPHTWSEQVCYSFAAFVMVAASIFTVYFAEVCF